MRRSKLRVISIEESEDFQLKGPVNIFNKIIEENFLDLKKNAHEHTRSLQNAKKIGPENKFHHHIIIKTSNSQNKERILKAVRGKRWSII